MRVEASGAVLAALPPVAGAPKPWLLLLAFGGLVGCAVGEGPAPIEIPASSGKEDGVRGPWLLETHPGGDGFDITGRDGSGAVLARVSLLAPSSDSPARLEIESAGAPIFTEIIPAAGSLPIEPAKLDPRTNRLLGGMGEDLERWVLSQEDALASESMALVAPAEDPAEPNECIPGWLRPAVPETCGSLLAAWGGLYVVGAIAMLHPAGRALGWGAKLLGTSGRLAAWLQALVPAHVAAAAGTTTIPYYLATLKLAWERCHTRRADAPIEWCPGDE